MTRPRQVLIGAVAGALLAFAGVLLAPEAQPATEAGGTTTTTSTPDDPRQGQAWWHDPNETLVGPIALIPERLFLDDGIAVLTYRVEEIAPATSGFVVQEQDGPPVGPERFVLVTSAGEIEGDSNRIDSREVRFTVDEGFSSGDVTAIRLERYWMRVPYDSEVDLPAVRGAAANLDEHVTVSVEAVVEQAESVIVNLDTSRLSDDFIAARNPIVWITGRGPGWRSSIRQSGAGIGGNTGVQLIHDGVDLPDVLPLRVMYPQWIPVETSVELDLEGLDRG